MAIQDVIDVLNRVIAEARAALADLERERDAANAEAVRAPGVLDVGLAATPVPDPTGSAPAPAAQVDTDTPPSKSKTDK